MSTHPMRLTNDEVKVAYVALMGAHYRALTLKDAERGMTADEFRAAINSLLSKLKGPAQAALNAEDAR